MCGCGGDTHVLMPKKKSDPTISVVVTAAAGEVDSVVTDLKNEGLQVDSVLREIGIVTGRIPKSKLSTLKPRPGVTIEEDKGVQLPPPDAPIQ